MYDKFDYCFFEEYVEDGKLLNDKIFEKFGLKDNKYIKQYLNKEIYKELNIKIKNFVFNFDMLKKHGQYVNVLKSTILYSDVIPSKRIILSENDNDDLNLFFKSINEKEYYNIIRKIIINDRSIEIDYKNLEMKYKINFDFNTIDKIIRNYILCRLSDVNFSLIESNFYNENIIMFDCTKSKSIISKPPRERIKLEYYENDDDLNEEYYNERNEHITDYNSWDEQIVESEELAIQKEQNDVIQGRINDPSYFDYEDPDDFNPYEDDYGDEEYDYYDDSWDALLDSEEYDEDLFDEFVAIIDALEERLKCNIEKTEEIECSIYNDISNIYLPSILRFKKIMFKLYEDVDYSQQQLKIHSILHNNFLNDDNYEGVYVNLYSILQQIIEFDEKIKPDQERFTLTLLDHKFSHIDQYKKTILNISFKKLLSTNNVKIINKMYNYVFKEKYDIISFGIYDILNNDEYNKLSKIIKRLRVKGISSNIDYLITIGLKMLIDSYDKFFISHKHTLLEKLLNKYLINKVAKVYANTIVISDEFNNYIPINALSTGERNLIILFTFCLSNKDTLIVLDEPDLSMSVEWQSKILVDLLKFTNNKYIIVTQSPLVIQKNNLSSYVKRMDFNDEIETIELLELVKTLYALDRSISTDENSTFDVEEFDISDDVEEFDISDNVEEFDISDEDLPF